MSQADLTIQGHSSAGAMAEPAFSVPAKKMAMWLFIIADSATFAGCLVAYGFIRNATPNWPRPFHSITNVAVMTLILLTSSLTMLMGVRAAQAGDKPKAFRWVMITAVAGVLLIAVGIRYQGGRYKADDLEITGLYWHFVDLVWMFVVPLVYLLNIAH